MEIQFHDVKDILNKVKQGGGNFSPLEIALAKMAYRCETINPEVQPAPQELQDKHYYRKHGANAYYGQGSETL